MGAAGIELPEWVNEKTVEYAHGRVIQEQRKGHVSIANAGMRAAKARDGKLLKALEGGAEILQAMNDRQHGPHMRINGVKYNGTTELQLWREAYKMCDKGEPMAQFQWIYAAAGIIAGLIP